MEKKPCVYILTSNNNSVIYVGVTSQLPQRIWQHKNNVVEGFTKQYKVHKLVYVEFFEDITLAIAREKQLKQWRREWKFELIRKSNPDLRDIFTSYQ
ncbi:GIY-YIG nuclease family protein [Vibrio alginolyticus]|uniref:GIY-YIG nuclease family protein n=1 Tax=Vibrio sp. B1FLJ16 TaxID=2751178 RepID=UPI0015F38F30|nr:GIY-YIG nuclease family protein [Vibrio sp. B1FLJ16]CAD7797751.1 Endonuclease containing a URI domain [Vibrio sp. B1FLJ16]CAE6881791.1 Endonuclease containing a URI domain [Vibrio sp. B1FLJ16]